MNFNKLILLLSLPLLFLVVSCDDEPETDPTCTDGIMNQNETGIDCGGSCDPCVVLSCSDGIMNQDETDIDCGGSCDPCIAEGIVSANVNNTAWQANTPALTFQGNTFNLTAINANDNSRIVITVQNLTEAGNVPNFSLIYNDGSDSYSIVASEEVNQLDIIKLEGGKISGNFQGDVKYADPNTGTETVLTIRNGQFRNLTY